MSETPYVTGAARPWAPGRTISTSALLGQVMFLVALAVGFAALGSVIGKVFSIAPSPIVALAIYGFSAALILVDFNYLRKHGTEDDAIMLATGIFVSIVNIFTSLLSLFQR